MGKVFVVNVLVGKLFVGAVIVIVVKLFVMNPPGKKVVGEAFVSEIFVGAVIVTVVKPFVKAMLVNILVEVVVIEVEFDWKGFPVKLFVTKTPGPAVFVGFVF